MRKTAAQIARIRSSGIRFPLFWDVVLENGNFLHIRNWMTGENRILNK